MSEEINLGVPEKDLYDSPCCMPVAGKEEKGSEVVYPRFHYSGPIELDLPDHGEMTIHFRKKTETSEILEDGSHWYECDIEVRKILDFESEDPEAPTSRNNGTEEALDKLAEALSRRNGNGEGDHNDENGGY